MDSSEDLISVRDGKICAKYRDWTEIPDQVWVLNLTSALRILNVSFNSITFLPEKIILFTSLIELDCSCNKIEFLPRNLGSLVKLKTLKVNGNCLHTIPNEIGNCTNLENLHLNENMIQHLPDSIGECSQLRILKLQNNSLKSITCSLGKKDNQINEIDLTNNPNLQMIPKKVLGNTNTIMWILSLGYCHSERMKVIEESTQDTRDQMQKSSKDINRLERKINDLEIEKKSLIIERTSAESYMNFKEKWKKCRLRMNLISKHIHKLFSRNALIYGDE